MDLSELAYEDTAVMDIKGHDDKPLKEGRKASQIEVYGPDSEEAIKAQAKFRDARIKASGDADELKAAECRLLSDFTKELLNVKFKGKAATKKDAFSIYRDVSMVRGQVDRFVVDSANFIKSSKKS